MLKRIIKCLPVLLAALLLTGCGELSTPELAGRLAAVIGTADAAEALEVLGLPADEEEDGASSYTLSACPELVPEGIEADESELSLSKVELDVVTSVLVSAVCEEMEPEDAYQAMRTICDELSETYPESAFSGLYEDYVPFNGGEILSFTETFPTETDFLEAYQAKSDDTAPVVEAIDCWWADEEKTVAVYAAVRFRPDKTTFLWAAENAKAVRDYITGISPFI